MDESEREPSDEQHTTPRWVRIAAIAAAVVIAAVVLVMLLSGGDHGPGRHLPGGDGHTPPVDHG